MRTRATTTATTSSTSTTTTGTNASATADAATTAFTDRETRLTFFSSQKNKTQQTQREGRGVRRSFLPRRLTQPHQHQQRSVALSLRRARLGDKHSRIGSRTRVVVMVKTPVFCLGVLPSHFVLACSFFFLACLRCARGTAAAAHVSLALLAVSASFAVCGW